MKRLLCLPLMFRAAAKEELRGQEKHLKQKSGQASSEKGWPRQLAADRVSAQGLP